MWHYCYWQLESDLTAYTHGRKSLTGQRNAAREFSPVSFSLNGSSLAKKDNKSTTWICRKIKWFSVLEHIRVLYQAFSWELHFIFGQVAIKLLGNSLHCREIDKLNRNKPNILLYIFWFCTNHHHCRSMNKWKIYCHYGFLLSQPFENKNRACSLDH